jgi:capsular polysaccharide biosynthesis protein
MELFDYIRIIRKRVWIIVVVAAITTVSALVFSKIQTPIYRSTIYLNVIPDRLDWGLQQTVQGLMRNYAGQIQSRTTAAQVIDRLQLDITPAELAQQADRQQHPGRLSHPDRRRRL